MHSKRNLSFLSLAIIAVSLLFSGVSFGNGDFHSNFPNIKIKNFGQMDDRFYRGAQPKEDDYKALAALGIRTVIDLRDEPKAYEKPAVEAADMRYVNIPMDDKSYPKAEQIDAFLKLVDSPESGSFYAHCAGGRHRTGVVGAIYRYLRYNWNYDQVYAEIKQYDFYTRWGHGPMKKFVQEYWQQLQTHSSAPAAATN
jgi:protein tyrosine/serine phosphatase